MRSAGRYSLELSTTRQLSSDRHLTDRLLIMELSDPLSSVIGGVESEGIAVEDKLERMFRSHVENCLKSLWENNTLVTNEHGAYPFERDGVVAWIAVRGRYVRIHAVAASGLRRSARLFGEINEQNVSSWWTRTYFERGQVVVEVTMPWPAVDPESLAFSIDEVVGTVARIGPLVSAVHGGQQAASVGAA